MNIYISDQSHNRFEPHNEYMIIARYCQILMLVITLMNYGRYLQEDVAIYM